MDRTDANGCPVPSSHARFSAGTAAKNKRGYFRSVSEIEFRTPYVVAERWIVARMLRFMSAKNVHSDTLSVRPQNSLQCKATRKTVASIGDARGTIACSMQLPAGSRELWRRGRSTSKKTYHGAKAGFGQGFASANE
jgi:hypothetical protein